MKQKRLFEIEMQWIDCTTENNYSELVFYNITHVYFFIFALKLFVIEYKLNTSFRKVLSSFQIHLEKKAEGKPIFCEIFLLGIAKVIYLYRIY